MVKLFFLSIVSLIAVQSWSQQLTGSFSQLPEQYVVLHGFEGIGSYAIDSVRTDVNGAFSLRFSAKDYGMGFLLSADKQPLIVVLDKENIELHGEALGWQESIRYIKGGHNKSFVKYAIEQPKREQVISAWEYLQRAYHYDSLFSVQQVPNTSIERELSRLAIEEQTFLENLPEGSYIKWFLPVRKLVSTASEVAQYRVEDIPTTLQAFRQLNYGDPRMFKSGLLREAIENHVWFIENSSGALDAVYRDLNASIDGIIEQTRGDEAKFNEVTDYLFNLLEERSLFTSSEYLALKVLNEQSCNVSADLANQLEGYRKMKVGNKAPNIVFSSSTMNEGKAKSLDDLKSDYTVVVFAAGWCGHCQTEIPKLKELYADWKSKGVEVVLVSLDETKDDFVSFCEALPFISTTDYKKWEGQAVQEYHVFGTPTVFLLDIERTILLRPNSVEHLKAWLEYNIMQ